MLVKDKHYQQLIKENPHQRLLLIPQYPKILHLLLLGLALSLHVTKAFQNPSYELVQI